MPADDVIIAVSSPPGRSARGLIRVSGPALAPSLASLLAPVPAPRRLSSTRIQLSPSTPAAATLPILALFHPAPRSFTGQDTLELQLPGNPALLERVLHQVQRHFGARLAEPGEFTQRAFFAGRIDLTRAEGIAATIGAVSDAQLRAAALLRTGRLGAWATGLVERLAHLLALVEAGIDFVDQDDVVAIAPAQLEAGLAGIEAELRGMLEKSRAWSTLEALPWVVLVGEPNVGKSTLFNALLGRTRAVTSDVAGTTRDILAEPLVVEGGEVMLVDVAGLDAATAGLNRAMQEQVASAIARAELILLLHDGAGEPAIALPPHAAPVVRVQTKCDLFCGTNGMALCVSAHTGAGLDALRRAIGQRLRDRAVSVAGEMLALQPRHRAEIESAVQAIADARRLSGAGPELVADRMRAALDHLASLGGTMTPDDVIGKVFATFCIGK